MRALPHISLLTLIPALGMHVMAQSTEPPADPIEEAASSGQRTLPALRAEIRSLERDMFAIFNKLNSTDDFDVTCGYNTPTGSKIPSWQCEPAFMRLAEGAEFMQMKDNSTPGAAGITGIGYVPQSRNDIALLQQEKVEQMQSELKTLAFEHAELGAAVMTLHTRRLQLAEMERTANE